MKQKTRSRFAALFAAASVLCCGHVRGQATIPGDFADITGTSAGQSVSGWGSPGSVALHGKSAFPVLMDTGGVAMMAAGRYNDGTSGTTARAVAFSHNGPIFGGSNSMPTLLEASVKWASRKTTPSTITVGCGAGIATSFWTTRGYLTKSVTTTMSTSANDLSGVDVFIFDWHSGYSASAVTKIQTFTAAGGSIVCGATPWALGATPTADAYAVMGPFGLTYSGSGWSGPNPATVPSTAPSAYYSALNGSGDLIRDKEGLITLSLADKTIAANSIDQVLAVRTDLAALNTDMKTLSDGTHYGTIAPTQAAPIAKATKPVEAMLTRYQSNKFDAMTPAQLFAHPSASDFPGAPLAGSTVSRTVSVSGNTPVDFYMNQGYKATRIETGVYAAPGATITITIPSDKTGAGLQAHISPNGSEDQIWNQSTWTFFPKLWRRVSLTATSTQTGSVMGGLVTILVPANSSLGTFDVTVTGALPAPAFTLGVNTDTEWNATLKNHPAPYGFIKTDKLVMYVERSQLAALTNPTEVANHWKTVMDVGDEYYGYSAWRKRGEAIASARYVAYGAAYAGYPIEAGWGVGEDAFLNNPMKNGSWGNYHELGHGYQDDFDGAFVIPTHAEADVNLLPGMIYNMVHKRTAWDNSSHPSLDASERLARRAQYLALPAVQQTWQTACEGDPVNDTGETVYDFYYNISEAFGWTAYKTALGRLMNYLQNPSGSTDLDIKNLSTSDPNFKRNRFYILFCDATGRNLDSYFQRYGLGVTGKGFEITQSVKDLISSRGYPVWNDNSAMTAISNPGTVTLPEDTPQGTLIHDFSVTDPDPGETHTYAITAGDANGDFSIDRYTGELRVFSIDYERTTSYSLTVTASGDGIPFSGTRHTIVRTFTVNVTNTPDSPVVAGKLFTATSAMSSGTVLGTATATLDPSRTVSAWAITAGNGSGIFAINSSGQVILQTPGSLGSPAAYQLTVRVTDSEGQAGYGQVTVYANAALGVREERWTGWNVTTGTPVFTGYQTSFTTAQNVADNYTRRLSGWIIPPTTGLYTFWIASDDDSRLSLSTSASSSGIQDIATVGGWTGYQSWDEKSTQKSASKFLIAGHPYYVEAVQSEGGGGDHVAVAWSGPGITRAVIPGSVLVPAAPGISLSTPAPAAPSITLTSPSNGASFSAPASIPATATVTDNSNNITKVQFLDGGIVFAEDYAPPYSATLNTSVPGPHPVKARVVYGLTGATVDSSTATVTVTSGSLPSGWTGGDIGAIGVAGSSSYSGGVYTISGSGADIWGTSDEFHFASTTMTGDGEIRARVTSQANTHVWAKAGVMIRDTTAANSAHAMMVVTPGNGFAFQYRTTTGGGSSHIAGPALNAFPNNWVRLTRSGNLITSYVSANGTTWTQVGQATITLGSTISVGLPVLSTDDAVLGSATFDNVAVTPYPLPWLTADIGTTGLAGRSEFFGSTHTLNGAGVIGGTADGFRFTYQALSGDGTIIARIPALGSTGTSARVGVMIRDTLAANSRNIFMGVHGTAGYRWTRRTTAGGSTTTTNSSSGTVPNVWVRLVRSGTTITASKSTNGTSWTTVGSTTISFATNCYIGLAVGSGSTTTMNTSSFDNLSVTP